MIAAGLKSIGTRVNTDSSVSREWVNADSRLLSELLLSDLGGCFKLDRTRVYLEGASQGTCFLSAALSNFLWRDFKGGVIGLCGCWGTGEFDYPVSPPALRSGFKVLVENTTELCDGPRGRSVARLRPRQAARVANTASTSSVRFTVRSRTRDRGSPSASRMAGR